MQLLLGLGRPRIATWDERVTEELDRLEELGRPSNERVLEIVRYFFSAGKPVAALCHGPQLLAAADVLDGRSCSCYPAVAPDVRLAGGSYADIPIDGAHVDGNLVTGPAWPAHPAWLAAFLEVLGTRITHEQSSVAEPVA